MKLNFFPKKNVVNLVIQDYSIRFMELENEHSTTPFRWGEHHLPAGLISNGTIKDAAAVKTILGQCVDEWNIRKRPVRFLVPDSFVNIRKVSIPADIKEDEIRGYLYLEIGSSIHLPFNDPVFDTVLLDVKDDQREVLIIAAEEEHVKMYSELLESCKLKPVAAEISALALHRLYYSLGQAEKDEHLLVAQFDLDKVNICIFSGSIPLVMHHIPIEILKSHWDLRINDAGNYEWHFIGDAVKEIDYQYSDTFTEIGRLADFYRYSLTHGKSEITKILVHGDHPLLSFILDELKNRFDIPIVTIDEQKLSAKLNNPLPRNYHLVMGLALKEVQKNVS